MSQHMLSEQTHKHHHSTISLSHVINYRSAHSVIAGEFDKCLHSLSIFLAQKPITGLIIQYILLNVIGKNY
jgi:hypothetical protein